MGFKLIAKLYIWQKIVLATLPNFASLPDCQIARLGDWEIARLGDCQIARLRDWEQE